MDLHGSEISRVCIDPRISRVCSKFRAFVNGRGFVPNFAHSRISRRFDTHAEYNIVKPYAATSCQLNAERRGQVVLVLVQRRQDRDDEHEWRRPSDAAASLQSVRLKPYASLADVAWTPCEALRSRHVGFGTSPATGSQISRI